MRYFVWAILCSSVFFSCKKDSVGSTPTPTPTPTASTLLKQFIVVDTTLPATAQRVYSYYFEYDASNRCSAIRGSDGVDSFIVFNYYNGTDTLIVRRSSATVNTADSTMEYFTYNSGGKMLTDSMIEYGSLPAKFMFDYQSVTNSGGIVKVRSNGVQFEYNRFASTRASNGNLLNVKDSLFWLTGGAYSLTEASNANISYDAKPNPLYKTVPGFPINVLAEAVQVITFLPFQSLVQANNIVTETRVFNPTNPGLDNVNMTCQYEYKSNSYPSVVRMHDVQNNQYYKGTYVY